MPLIQRRRRGAPGPIMFFSGALAGAATQYFNDPIHGRRRRHVAGDRLRARMRRSFRHVTGYTRFLRGRTYGAFERSLHLEEPDNPDPDDNTLRDRVESQLLGRRDVVKGDIKINVADGIVEIRGQADYHDDIARIGERVHRIPVSIVHNYLHLPDTPAPNKARVLTTGKSTSGRR